MLVVDPTVVLPMLAAQPTWTSAGSDDLVAPPLLWSECRSLLHDLARRGTIPAAEARRMRRAAGAGPLRANGRGHPSRPGASPGARMPLHGWSSRKHRRIG